MKNIAQVLANIPDVQARTAVYNALKGVYDRLSNVCFSTCGLAIKTTNSLLVSVKTATTAMVNGSLVTVGTQDCAVLSGTISATKYNVFCFFVDAAGTLTTLMGREATALKDVLFPVLPEKKVMLGFVIIQGGAAAAFIGNDATAGQLDATTYAASATYINCVGSQIDQTAKL